LKSFMLSSLSSTIITVLGIESGAGRLGPVFCPKARVTSIAYETRNGCLRLALRELQPSLDELADLCLTHLAQNPEQLADFMGIAGLSPNGLRTVLGTKSFALGLLDYVVHNEPLLVAISQSSTIKPETIMRVWAKHNPAG
jgi:hypothetical protein